jgi:hypothetical protein
VREPRDAAANALAPMFSALAMLGSAGKEAAVPTAEFIKAIIDPDKPDRDSWYWGTLAPALVAVARTDPELGRPLTLRFIDHVKNDRCGQWPSRTHQVMALDACDATNAAEVAPLIVKLSDWGKNLPIASALTQITLRADPAMIREKVLPILKGNLDGSLKDSNKGKLGLAIWAYYKAGGERVPLDWKPGGWQP